MRDGQASVARDLVFLGMNKLRLCNISPNEGCYGSWQRSKPLRINGLRIKRGVSETSRNVSENWKRVRWEPC
jgi:hypothetical protein